MTAITRRVLIQNKKGLHARAAAKFVKTAIQFSSKIMVTRLPRVNESIDAATATATSILSLLMLAGERGVELDIAADGEDAELALNAIETLINNKFDEGE
jgi:phosphotransferase system HPr (HPr) family protein